MNRGGAKTTIFYHPGLKRWCVKTAIPPGQGSTAKSVAKRLHQELEYAAGCVFNKTALALSRCRS